MLWKKFNFNSEQIEITVLPCMAAIIRYNSYGWLPWNYCIYIALFCLKQKKSTEVEPRFATNKIVGSYNEAQVKWEKASLPVVPREMKFRIAHYTIRNNRCNQKNPVHYPHPPFSLSILEISIIYWQIFKGHQGFCVFSRLWATIREQLTGPEFSW